MFNISITVDSDDQIKAINQLDVNAYFDIFDERYKKGKKDAWHLKNQYSAQLNPFVEIKKDGEFYKIIYKEACEDPISEISKML